METPGCRESQCTEAGGGGGGKRNNKKVEQQEDGPTGLAKARVCFPAPDHPSSNQAAVSVRAASTTELLPLPSPPRPPGKGKSQARKAEPSV